jgi:hypothetical protein
MTRSSFALAALLLAACATTPAPVRELSEVYAYTYHIDGAIGPEQVTGLLNFTPEPGGTVEYLLYTNRGTCHGRIHRPWDTRISIGCAAVRIEFLRAGRVAERSHASITVSRFVPVRECVRYSTTPQGGTVCAQWVTRRQEQMVTESGVLRISRRNG